MTQALTTAQFADVVENYAPLKAAYDWDNSGWNICCHEEIRSILVCLDVTYAVLEEAKRIGADTILSHHPLLFHAPGKWMYDDPVCGVAMEAVRAGINIYCAHTSFDCAPQGLNIVLAQKLGCSEIVPLAVERYDDQSRPLMIAGTVGVLPQTMSAEQAANYIKQKLGAAAVNMVGTEKPIVKVACVGGSGGDFMAETVRAGADALITGEVKHNMYQEARNLGIALFEAGHYDTEVLFSDYLTTCLQKEFFQLQYNLTVKRSEAEARPYQVV